MSRVLTANQIACEALGGIGQWPTSESAPDGEHVRRAMVWLDLILAETVGTARMFSRFNDTLSVTIVNGTQSYNLYSVLGANLPDDGIEFVVDAWLEDGNGNRTPLEIVTRQKFENVSKLAKTGTPCRIHIDTDDAEAPTLRIYPTPASTDSTAWTVKLVCQRYAPNVAPAGVTGTKPSGSIHHKLGQAWQRWAILQLTHDLGSGLGGFGKLPEASLNRFAGMAIKAKSRLEAFTEREHETTDPVCESWGLMA